MANTFGEFLKQKRQEKHLTQKELANMLYISESAVSKWEKDVAHPDITLLPKLAEVLQVTEHELITASVDKDTRKDKVQAKKWRTLTCGWNLFFYISYAITILTCFICNLAIDGGLTWFWIVLASLVLAFTFTNLSSIITKNKLLILPISIFISLCLLLAVCCIYTGGNWFFIATLSTLFGLSMIFVPIYIAKYNIFKCIRKYNDYVTIGVEFVLLNILLIVIDVYTVTNAYALNHWYMSIALPIVIAVYLVLNLLISIKWFKFNKLMKTSIVLYLVDIFLYLPPMFVKVSSVGLQTEINQMNVLKANLSLWVIEKTLENNIHLIICLTMVVVATAFMVAGICYTLRKSKNKTK